MNDQRLGDGNVLGNSNNVALSKRMLDDSDVGDRRSPSIKRRLDEFSFFDARIQVSR